MGTRRRPPAGGWPDAVETVPLRDTALDAPKGARAGERVVEPDEPPIVRAWITYGREQREAEVDGWAIGWTSRQVRVRYLDAAGRQGWAWVWASAVTRR
ncbi:hypothetical protein [Isoptericola sp. QY 916]|uniref:hypothetical protein n=1 Tax=Isoptericola sp. QY 916 TaxID=2782570 RepID=UPI003D2FCF0B|nr:hypothetical protein [Isoptericola sp. QY 916]